MSVSQAPDASVAVPTAARDVAVGAPWSFDHATMAQVIAAEIGTPLQRAVEGWLIDARRVVFDPAASPSLRKIAARVIARWGL